MDLRREAPAELDRLELKMLEAIRLGAEEGNEFREASGQKVTAEAKLIGNRPTGVTQESNALVQAALTASRRTGHQPKLAVSSTDSNLPISLGIPASPLAAVNVN